VNGVVPNSILARHRHLDSGHLLFESAEIVHGVILDKIGSRIIVRLRARRFVAASRRVAARLGRATNRALETDHGDAASTRILKVEFYACVSCSAIPQPKSPASRASR
jgi:hypothetical protein